MGFIYKITNKINLKIYIGKCQCTVEERFKQHCYRAVHWYDKEQNFRSHLYPAMNQDGIENFEVETLEECPNNILGTREKYYIKLYNALDSTVGYNIAAGGESFWEGHHHTDETKQKISEHSAKVLLGKHLSEETKQKLSEAHKGKCFRQDFHHTDETKQKLSKIKKGKTSAFKGKKHSEETKRKLSKQRLGKKFSEETKLKQSTNIKKALEKISQEDLSARSKKGWDTRRKKKEN